MAQKNKPVAKPKTVKTTKKQPTVTLDAALISHPHSSFPIVGIGASAGGLEALELFLANVPENNGMAFVIIQHLDPTHKGMMVELLQRITPMQVFQTEDHTRIKPNCVYVIPPNKDMSILRGVLFLLDPITPRGLRLPIDFFFRSLADDQREHSVGVILSGMGSDGTLGLRSIKEKAGVVFVQQPTSAKFDGMPNSAIEAGLADVVAPAEELPAKISAYLQQIPLIARSSFIEDEKSKSSIEKVIILLRTQTGHDFSLYKRATLYRRIERRMGIHQIEKLNSYVRFLQENPQEVEILFHELLIGVTNFFRDPAAWEQMKSDVLSALLARQTPNQVLRAWVPACSTGEEAYSLAMLFKEALETQSLHKQNITLQIFATDLDSQAIDKAREGLYPANIAADVKPERLSRFFTEVGRGYQISKSIREMVIFAQQNIAMDPPFTKLDILSCRNLLIYLTPELQRKLLPLFHYSLNPGGFLFLGSAETIGTFGNLFALLEGKARIYRRLEKNLQTEPVEFPSTFNSLSSTNPQPKSFKPAVNLQTLADQLLLQTYSPAAALTNEAGDILYISGRTGKYLEPAAGKANWNIFAMAREGLRYELTAAFQKSVREKEAITLKNLVIGTNGGMQIFNVTIQPVRGQNILHGTVMIVFTDIEAPSITQVSGKPRKNAVQNTRAEGLERELNHAQQEVQNIREEMQTSKEELKSANEELQSTNEELQSTNEELTTSKEEMQSMNEELQTINHELQAKVDEELQSINHELQAKVNELSRLNNDMKNLLDSTNIATLFLDNALCVRRFTSQTSKVTKLIPGDVGRPITDIASALLYPQLSNDAQDVLSTLEGMERQIELPDGSWYSTRILPYRTLENKIDGVVITFTDITVSKKLEAELRGKNSEGQ